jgi:hypothetical protein
MKIMPDRIEQYIARVDRQPSLALGISSALLALWSVYRVVWSLDLAMTYDFLFGSLIFQIVLWALIGAVAAIAAIGFLSRYMKAPTADAPESGQSRVTGPGLVSIATTVVAAIGLGLAGLTLGAGTAEAVPDGPFTWCPGQSMDWPAGPNVTYGGIPDDYKWDMGICHTWYKVSWGYGNVPRALVGAPSLSGSSVWDGDNPPPANPSGMNCSPFWCPVPPHPDPNFHP